MCKVSKKSTSIGEFIVIVFFCVSVFNTMGLFVCLGLRGARRIYLLG